MSVERKTVLVKRKGKAVAIDIAVHKFNQRKKRERKEARKVRSHGQDGPK